MLCTCGKVGRYFSERHKVKYPCGTCTSYCKLSDLADCAQLSSRCTAWVPTWWQQLISELSVVSGVSDILPQPHCRSGLETGAVRTFRVSLVLVVHTQPGPTLPTNLLWIRVWDLATYAAAQAQIGTEKGHVLVEQVNIHDHKIPHVWLRDLIPLK